MPTYVLAERPTLRLVRVVRLATSQTVFTPPPVTQNQIWPRADRIILTTAP